MKKVLAILLCAVMTLSLVACGEESKEKQVQNEVTEVVDSNNNPTDSNASIAEPSNENDMIVGSWYCDEVQEELDFTNSSMVTATTPMVNISGSYKLEDGKIIMTYDIGEDIYEYELSDSALILKNSDGTYTFTRGTADFSIENAFAINVDANLLSVIVYEPNEADIRCQLEKRLQGSISIYLDGTPYMLSYADLGDGFYARVCNSDNGSILDTITYDISDTEIVFHADMSSYKDFSFEAVSGYTTCIDYDGNGGGMISYAVKDVVKHEERANTIAESTETSETSTANTAALPFVGVKYFSEGGAWGASEFVLKGADANGLPTEIVISNSGDSVSGLELNGTFSIEITEYSEFDNALIGRFVGVEHDPVKGEYVSGNGDRLMIQID